MHVYVPMDEAKENLLALQTNPYPGRGIVLGLNSAGDHLVQVSWTMGRSTGSRNRVYQHENGRLFTDTFDSSTMENQENIIYCAMAERANCFVVSNGHQTTEVLDALIRGDTFPWAMSAFKYESDAPNYTPRITGVIALGQPMVAALSILRKSSFGEFCERTFFIFERLQPGFGFCIHTYITNGNPLPSFRGEPFLLPLVGDGTAIAQNIWKSLDPDNRVSIAVKMIDKATGTSRIEIINKYTKNSQSAGRQATATTAVI